MNKTIHSDAYRTLISWLKACRKSQKVSMRSLAEILNVPHTWIAKVEQAERRLDIVEYVKVCEALDLDPRDGLDLLISTGYAAERGSRKRPLVAVADNKRPYRPRQ